LASIDFGNNDNFMKIAIVHDELVRRGGAEQVTRCFHMAFPEAPIFTLAYHPHNTYDYFQSCQVSSSWFQKVASNEKNLKRFFFPFGIMAMKQLDVSSYDVVLMSSTYCAKYVKVSRDALVINYCHQPFRLAWYPESYSEYLQSRGLKRAVFNLVISLLKKIDYKAAQRTDYFIANTTETGNKIRDSYGFKKNIEVVKPPVDCRNFAPLHQVKDYYLVVTRLEYYKRADLVVQAFNELGLPLIIVGKGSKEKELKQMARPNITFRSGVPAEELKQLYAECKALIFPQYEDYGITPLEANASGRPVIAYGKGGVLETMIPYRGDASKATALFFDKQEKEHLIQAVREFQQLEGFDPAFIRKHAESFDEPQFIARIKGFVQDKYKKLKP
jgi:glycosyltransferase involved in cell wall biosynthesis